MTMFQSPQGELVDVCPAGVTVMKALGWVKYEPEPEPELNKPSKPQAKKTTKK